MMLTLTYQNNDRLRTYYFCTYLDRPKFLGPIFLNFHKSNHSLLTLGKFIIGYKGIMNKSILLNKIIYITY